MFFRTRNCLPWILCENQDIEFLTTLDQNIEQCTIDRSECGQRTIYTMKWDSQCKPENFLFELSVWRPRRALGNQELVSNRNTSLSFDLCSNQSRIGNKELLWTHESFNFRKTHIQLLADKSGHALYHLHLLQLIFQW